MITICKQDNQEYTLLDGADFYRGDNNKSIYSAPAIDNDGSKYLCLWYFFNEDIKDKDLEDLDWDYCDEIISLD